MLAALKKLAFYKTQAHDCGYLPQQMATTLFADPHAIMTMALYSSLADYGFRRSGSRVYRPHCTGCQACISVRIPVERFTPSRCQRRTWKRNQDIQVTAHPAQLNPAHFQLYQHYVSSRHAGGGMDQEGIEQYERFLISPWADTVFYEFHCGSILVAVAVVDRLQQGLSAVYTFYRPTPEWASRSLGRFAILWQIEEARRLQLPWLYLGYWVAGCQKMAYKRQYQPIEGYRLKEGQWQENP